jgi:sodium-dependent phosphate cotransporter
VGESEGDALSHATAPVVHAASGARRLRRALWLLPGLLLFVLALELLKRGAAGLAPLLRALDVDGLAGGLGFGWLAACVVLSGSPVAAIALALLAGGSLDTGEAFAMVGGSRLGAAFVVLLVGALDDLRAGRRVARAAYVGVAALVATAAVYVPALGLGYLALRQDLLAGLRFEGRALGSLLDAAYGPLTALALRHLPRVLVFLAGGALLLGSFRLVDKALPELEPGAGPLAGVGRVLYRPWAMFLIGAGVTGLTLSVSVSLSVLVPLTVKGWLRRENLWPYILGANVTTFVDTLLAGALVGHPDAVRIVALQMVCVLLLSLPIVLLFPYAFERWLDHVARAVTESRARLLAFVAALLLVPALLMAL